MRVASIKRVAGLMTVLLWAALAAAAGQSPSLSTDEIIRRVEATQSTFRSHSVPYAVTRRYVLSDADPKTPDSQVVAHIQVVSPSSRGYTLGSAEGGDRVEKVVRKVLDHEAEMSAHADRGEVSSRNYDFALLGQESLNGRRCYVLQLKPKREAAELIRGKAWVDSQDFMIHRLTGEPAKSPSWWIKNMQLTLEYGEVYGMWMQMAARAVANVRMFGTQTLSAKNLEVRTASTTASLRPVRQTTKGTVRNSGVWLSR